MADDRTPMQVLIDGIYALEDQVEEIIDQLRPEERAKQRGAIEFRAIQLWIQGAYEAYNQSRQRQAILPRNLI